MASDERKGITIRVNPDLHAKIKIHAIKKGLNLPDYILGLIKEDMNKEKE